MKKEIVRCPCCSQKEYTDCCGRYLEFQHLPTSPEMLMRSRYTAYSIANIDYIKKTMRGKPLIGFDEANAKRWAKHVIWIGLRIIKASKQDDKLGYVEFIAQYIEGNQLKSIHETSEFHCDEGVWFYVDGVQQPKSHITVSRNMTCPCGSQKKFKNCHALGRTT